MNRDAGLQEETIIKNGHKPLTGSQLQARLAGTTIMGDYAAVFKYIMAIHPDGKLEGRNNVGSHHLGQWTIDEQAGTMTVSWQEGWANTTTRIYDIEGKLKLFDIKTGNWETTFWQITPGCDVPLISPTV